MAGGTPVAGRTHIPRNLAGLLRRGTWLSAHALWAGELWESDGFKEASAPAPTVVFFLLSSLSACGWLLALRCAEPSESSAARCSGAVD